MSELTIKIENRSGVYTITGEDGSGLILSGEDLDLLLKDLPTTVDMLNKLNDTEYLMAEHGYAP